VSTAPVEVLTLARLLTLVPWTVLNDPPRYAVEQSAERAMVYTSPFTLGSHDDTAPVVALNENTLFLATLALAGAPIEVNVPTAYIVEPHCASCRTVLSALAR